MSRHVTNPQSSIMHYVHKVKDRALNPDGGIAGQKTVCHHPSTNKMVNSHNSKVHNFDLHIWICFNDILFVSFTSMKSRRAMEYSENLAWTRTEYALVSRQIFPSCGISLEHFFDQRFKL